MPRPEGIAALLQGFFAAHARPDAHRNVISLRCEMVTQSKVARGWPASSKGRYTVEDPLEEATDTTRMLTPPTMRSLRLEITRAVRLLSLSVEQGGGLDAVLLPSYHPLGLDAVLLLRYLVINP